MVCDNSQNDTLVDFIAGLSAIAPAIGRWSWRIWQQLVFLFLFFIINHWLWLQKSNEKITVELFIYFIFLFLFSNQFCASSSSFLSSITRQLFFAEVFCMILKIYQIFFSHSRFFIVFLQNYKICLSLFFSLFLLLFIFFMFRFLFNFQIFFSYSISFHFRFSFNVFRISDFVNPTQTFLFSFFIHQSFLFLSFFILILTVYQFSFFLWLCLAFLIVSSHFTSAISHRLFFNRGFAVRS